MKFKVIDNQTGQTPDCEKIALNEEWAKNLIYCDIDTFAITEDGVLVLTDDCGNMAYCPPDRFTVEQESENQKGNPFAPGEAVCPTCNSDLYFGGICDDAIRIGEYCPFCGQRINWEEIK
jgi:RNA polymerase subunit RPABC4/transcription elongation factor Spt4